MSDTKKAPKGKRKANPVPVPAPIAEVVPPVVAKLKKGTRIEFPLEPRLEATINACFDILYGDIPPMHNVAAQQWRPFYLAIARALTTPRNSNKEVFAFIDSFMDRINTLKFKYPERRMFIGISDAALSIKEKKLLDDVIMMSFRCCKPETRNLYGKGFHWPNIEANAVSDNHRKVVGIMRTYFKVS